MKSALSAVIKQPITWIVIFITAYSLINTFSDGNLRHVIRTDGQGYYAYLPAMLIFNDPDFSESADAEDRNHEQPVPRLYLFKDQNGTVYNKYFPGMAVMQLPFFGIACAVSWLFDKPIDGYSTIFLLCYYLGSLCYTIAGVLLFSNVLKQLFPDRRKLLNWLIPAFFASTAILYYLILTPCFTHLFSFFLFGVFAKLIVGLRTGTTPLKLFYTGVIIGLITLVRPTNIVVVLMIPFLLGSKEAFIAILRSLGERKFLPAISGILGFGMVISILFICWKWQTGQWIFWSYNGEGFDFLHPPLLAALFSFRAGLLLHTPILLVSLFGCFLLFRENRFLAVWWLLYFMANVWIISSWWCWDYESPISNRPYTEHLFFLLIPVIVVANRHKTFSIVVLTVLSLAGIIRFRENVTGFMGDQRYTRENFISSFAFWDARNDHRWNFTRACVPFGKKVREYHLVNDPFPKEITPADEFNYTVELELPKHRTSERFYYVVEVEKQLIDPNFGGVNLVIDATNKDNSRRFYKAVELLNDRLEGNGNWKKIRFEGHIYDNFQEYDKVLIYIWNQSHKRFRLRNVRISIEEYKAD